MTGIDYIMSPEGYYWTMNSANEGLGWGEIASESSWLGDDDSEAREKSADDEDRRLAYRRAATSFLPTPTFSPPPSSSSSSTSPPPRIWMGDEAFDDLDEVCTSSSSSSSGCAPNSNSRRQLQGSDGGDYYVDDPYDENSESDDWNATDFVELLDTWAQENGMQISDADFDIWHCDEEVMLNFITNKADPDQCNPFASNGDEFHMTGCPGGVFMNFTSAESREPYFYEPHASACPAGFFCPADYSCVIACVEGAACLPTVPDADGNQCVPDPAMGKGKAVNKVQIENGEKICPGAKIAHLCPKVTFD